MVFKIIGMFYKNIAIMYIVYPSFLELCLDCLNIGYKTRSWSIFSSSKNRKQNYIETSKMVNSSSLSWSWRDEIQQFYNWLSKNVTTWFNLLNYELPIAFWKLKKWLNVWCWTMICRLNWESRYNFSFPISETNFSKV